MVSFESPEAQPLLLWLCQNWPVVEPRLRVAQEKLDPAKDVLLYDVRIMRGDSLDVLDPIQVFDNVKRVEVEGMRKVMSSHPFLYNAKWTKQFSEATKHEVKKMAKSTEKQRTEAGCMVNFAMGDHAEQEKTLPGFTMTVGQFFAGDLIKVAEHNIRKQRELEVRREEVRRQVELHKQLVASIDNERTQLVASGISEGGTASEASITDVSDPRGGCVCGQVPGDDGAEDVGRET